MSFCKGVIIYISMSLYIFLFFKVKGIQFTIFNFLTADHCLLNDFSWRLLVNPLPVIFLK